MELGEETTTLNLISGKPDGSLAVMEYYKMAPLYPGFIIVPPRNILIVGKVV